MTRSRDLAGKAWWAVGALTVIVTILSFRVQPHLWQSFIERPWGYVFPALAMAGFVGISLSGSEVRAFLFSALYLLGMLTSVAFGLFPYVLPSNTDPHLSLTIYNTAPGEYGLRVGLAWWIPGMLWLRLIPFSRTGSSRGKSGPHNRASEIDSVKVASRTDIASGVSYKYRYIKSSLSSGKGEGDR